MNEWNDLVIDGEDPEEHIIRALDDNNNNNKGVIMTDNDALNQTRDALHTAFTIIANARNCLGNGERDPVLAEQWHEAAARFMQDYNANLDVYTGYRVSGRNECPTCSGPVRETVRMVCQTCGTDYGKEPCGEECGNSVHMHRCQITDGVPHDHICYDCGYTWTEPTESTLWKCADCGGIFFDRESHACPNAIERLTAERNEFKKDRDALRRRVEALTAQQTVTTSVVRGDGGERIEIAVCSRCSSVVAVKREDGDSDG